MVDWDSNHNKLMLLKSGKTDSHVTAHQEGYDWFQQQGVTTTLLELDDEISNSLIKAITTNGLNYQLASPDDHRQSPAERAM